MANYYTNIPVNKLANSSDATIQAFDAFYSQPLELNVSTFDAMTGFFESKGFDKSSAEVMAVTIIKQATIDSANPMEVLDTLKGLEKLEISAVVAEILNYNRFKTSFLGYTNQFTPVDEVNRNIIA